MKLDLPDFIFDDCIEFFPALDEVLSLESYEYDWWNFKICLLELKRLLRASLIFRAYY